VSLPPFDVAIIDPTDHVGTALRALRAGETVRLADGRTISMRDDVPLCHKLALSDIAAGAPVRKSGSAIGLATAEIAAGCHVHLHNLTSQRG